MPFLLLSQSSRDPSRDRKIADTIDRRRKSHRG